MSHLWRMGKPMNIIVIESEREPDHPSSSTIIVATQTITTEEVIASPRKKRRVIHTGKSKGCHICGKDDNRCFWIGCGYKKNREWNLFILGSPVVCWSFLKKVWKRFPFLWTSWGENEKENKLNKSCITNIVTSEVYLGLPKNVRWSFLRQKCATFSRYLLSKRAPFHILWLP